MDGQLLKKFSCNYLFLILKISKKRYKVLLLELLRELRNKKVIRRDSMMLHLDYKKKMMRMMMLVSL